MSTSKNRPFNLNMSMNEIERRHFEAAAKRAGLPVRTWVRRTLYRAVKESQPVLESAS